MTYWICEEVRTENGGYIEPVKELIRCKDCKYAKVYYHGEQSNLGMFTYYCIRGLYHVNENEYCSKAERKEE